MPENLKMRNGISVIIPTYNREALIVEAIESVLNQKYEGPLEIIISDDGSTDNTIERVRPLSNKIKIITRPDSCTTHGAANARNRGIRSSSHPFICFLDSDDFYLPGHLYKMVSAFENNPEIGFVFCRVLEIKEENGASLFRPWTREHVLKNDIKNPVVSRSQIVNTNSFMFRREVFDRVGNFNEVYSNGEDGDMWMRISEQFKGKFADHFGATYRINHGSNQLTSNAKEKIKQCGLLIFENCQKRYFDLKLRDPKRIFKIKLNFLWAKPPSTFRSKLTYHFKYLVLSLRYPSGYLQKKIEDYYDKKEAPKSGAWYKLDEYIN